MKTSSFELMRSEKKYNTKRHNGSRRKRKEAKEGSVSWERREWSGRMRKGLKESEWDQLGLGLVKYVVSHNMVKVGWD